LEESLQYAVFLIVVAWKEVSVRCLNSAWRQLWIDAVAPRDFKGFQQVEEEPVVQEIVCLGSSLGLEMNEEDMEELVEDHRKELSFEELVELYNEEAEALKQRIAFGDEKDENKVKSHSIPAEDLKEVFSCWNKLSKLMKDYHPDTATVEMGLDHFNDTLMAHFWRVQKPRIKQSNLDSFFKKVDKRPPTDEPTTGQSPKMSRNDDSSPSTSMCFL